MQRILGGLRHSGSQRIQIHIRQSRQQRLFIQNRNTLETTLEKCALALVFPVRHPSQLQDNMQMVVEHFKTSNIDGENPGQRPVPDRCFCKTRALTHSG